MTDKKLPVEPTVNLKHKRNPERRSIAERMWEEGKEWSTLSRKGETNRGASIRLWKREALSKQRAVARFGVTGGQLFDLMKIVTSFQNLASGFLSEGRYNIPVARLVQELIRNISSLTKQFEHDISASDGGLHSDPNIYGQSMDTIGSLLDRIGKQLTDENDFHDFGIMKSRYALIDTRLARYFKNLKKLKAATATRYHYPQK